MTQTTPPVSSTANVPPPRRRRWWRWALGFVGLLLALVGALPTLLTTSPVIGTIESRASAAVGRPVQIEGISFGWFTPIEVRGVSLPAIAGEPAPLLELRRLRIPLTLAGALAMPPYSIDPIEVDGLHVAVHRRADGGTNATDIAARFAALAAGTPPPPAAAGPAAALPFSRLAVWVKDARFILHDDASTPPMRVGIEDLAAQATWLGPATDLVIEADSRIAIQDHRTPIALEAYVIKFTDEHGRLSFQQFAVKSDLLLAQHTSATLSVSLLRDSPQASFAATLDLAELSAIAGAVPAAAAAPTATGRVRIEGALALADALGMQAARLSVETEPIRVSLPAAPEPLLIERISWVTSATLAQALTRVESFDSRATSRQLALHVEGRALGWPLPADAQLRLRADARPDLPPVPLPGGPVQAAVEAQIAVDARSAKGAFHVNADATIRPRTVGPGPGLDVFATRLDVAASLDPIALSGRVSSLSATGLSPDFPWALAGDATFDPARAQASLALDTRAQDLLALAARFATPAPVAASGDLRLSTTIEADIARSVVALDGSLTALRLNVADTTGALLWNEPEVRLSLRMRTDASARIEVQALDLNTEWAAIKSTASVDPATGGGFDGVWQVNLPVVLSRAEAHLPTSLPISLTGTARGSLRTAWRTDGSVRASGDFRMPESRLTLPPWIDGPLPLEAAWAVRARPGDGGDWTIHVDHASAGLLGVACAQATAVAFVAPDRGSVSLSSTVDLDHAALLGFPAPDFMETLPAQVALDGTSRVHLDVVAPFRLAPEGFTPDADTTVRLATESTIPALSWSFGDMAGGVSEIDLITAVSLRDPLGAMSPRIEIDARTGVIEAPFGVAMESAGLSLDAVVRKDLSVDAALAADTGETTLTLALGALRLAPTKSALNLRAGQAAGRISRLDVQLGDAVAGNLSASWQVAPLAWASQGRVRVIDLNRLAATLGDEGTGGIEATGSGELSWRLASPAAGARRIETPVQGTARFSLGDVGLAIAGVPVVEGLDTQGFTEFSGDDAELRFAGAVASAGAGAFALRGIEYEAESDFRDADRFGLRVNRLAVASLGTEARGSLSVGSLFPLIEPYLRVGDSTTAEPATLRQVLETITFEGTFDLDQALGPLGAVVPAYPSDGRIGSRFSIRSRPGGRLAIRLDSTASEVATRSGNLYTIEGLSGDLALRKSWPLSASAPPFEPPPWSTLRIARIGFAYAPMSGSIEGVVIRSRGVDGGVEFLLDADRFLGGPARARGLLQLEGGRPVLRATMEATGMDGRTLIPGLRALPARDSEIDAVARLVWELDDQATSLFDGMDLTIEATRAGRSAIDGFLQALDPAGTQPSIQAGRTALRLGTATRARFVLAGNSISMSATIQAALGPAVPIALLERVPLGEIATVYGLDRWDDLLELTRESLLLMLEDDPRRLIGGPTP